MASLAPPSLSSPSTPHDDLDQQSDSQALDMAGCHKLDQAQPQSASPSSPRENSLVDDSCGILGPGEELHPAQESEPSEALLNKDETTGRVKQTAVLGFAPPAPPRSLRFDSQQQRDESESSAEHDELTTFNDYDLPDLPDLPDHPSNTNWILSAPAPGKTRKERRSTSSSSGFGSKSFRCDYAACGKSFARRSDLTRHKNIHSGHRPYVCEFPQCGKSFIQRSALTVHFRVHTGERPHICDLCSKAFSDSSSLARHRRIHTGHKPFKCDVAGCHREFCRKITLTKHARRVHGAITGSAKPFVRAPTLRRKQSSNEADDDVDDEQDQMDAEGDEIDEEDEDDLQFRTEEPAPSFEALIGHPPASPRRRFAEWNAQVQQSSPLHPDMALRSPRQAPSMQPQSPAPSVGVATSPSNSFHAPSEAVSPAQIEQIPPHPQQALYHHEHHQSTPMMDEQQRGEKPVHPQLAVLQQSYWKGQVVMRQDVQNTQVRELYPQHEPVVTPGSSYHGSFSRSTSYSNEDAMHEPDAMQGYDMYSQYDRSDGSAENDYASHQQHQQQHFHPAAYPQAHAPYYQVDDGGVSDQPPSFPSYPSQILEQEHRHPSGSITGGVYRVLQTPAAPKQLNALPAPSSSYDSSPHHPGSSQGAETPCSSAEWLQLPTARPAPRHTVSFESVYPPASYQTHSHPPHEDPSPTLVRSRSSPFIVPRQFNFNYSYTTPIVNHSASEEELSDYYARNLTPLTADSNTIATTTAGAISDEEEKYFVEEGARERRSSLTVAGSF